MSARTAFIFMLYLAASSLDAMESKKAKSKDNCSTVNDIHQCHHSKSGKIELKINLDDLETEKISFVLRNKKITGDLLVFHTNIYDDDSYKDVIKSHFMLENLTDHHANIQYQIMFKDKVGVVAKTTGDISLPQGKNQQISCSSIPLHVNDIKNITSYEIKFITSNPQKKGKS